MPCDQRLTTGLFRAKTPREPSVRRGQPREFYGYLLKRLVIRYPLRVTQSDVNRIPRCELADVSERALLRVLTEGLKAHVNRYYTYLSLLAGTPIQYFRTEFWLRRLRSRAIARNRRVPVTSRGPSH